MKRLSLALAIVLNFPALAYEQVVNIDGVIPTTQVTMTLTAEKIQTLPRTSTVAFEVVVIRSPLIRFSEAVSFSSGEKQALKFFARYSAVAVYPSWAVYTADYICRAFGFGKSTYLEGLSQLESLSAGEITFFTTEQQRALQTVACTETGCAAHKQVVCETR